MLCVSSDIRAYKPGHVHLHRLYGLDGEMPIMRATDMDRGHLSMALHKLHMISFRANIHSGYFIIMTEDSPQQKAQEISNLGDCPICLQPMLVEEGGLAHLPCGHEGR